MFSLCKKKDQPERQNPQGEIPPVLLELRKTLYTNESLDPLLERIQNDSKSVFPWSNFIAASQALKENNKDKAISQLKEIVGTTQGLETRVRLQAWHTLVSLGELPVETLCGYTQGVVMENHTN